MSVHWDKEYADNNYVRCADCKKQCPYKAWRKDAGCTEGKKKDE